MKFEQQPITETHEKQYEEAKTHLCKLFVDKNPEKIDELYSQIKSYASVAGLDPETTIVEIKECWNIENMEEFVDKTFEILKKIIDAKIEHPEIFGKIQRERIIEHGGNIRLSELMYYEVDLENGVARIHIAPKGELGLGETLKAFREGLRELAKQVKENEKIKEIQAGSWIVASNPGLLKKAHFTVDGPISEEIRAKYFAGHEEPISSAHISREKLLEKHL